MHRSRSPFWRKRRITAAHLVAWSSWLSPGFPSPPSQPNTTSSFSLRPSEPHPSCSYMSRRSASCRTCCCYCCCCCCCCCYCCCAIIYVNNIYIRKLGWCTVGEELELELEEEKIKNVLCVLAIWPGHYRQPSYQIQTPTDQFRLKSYYSVS
jgi:hypothetical protein